MRTLLAAAALLLGGSVAEAADFVPLARRDDAIIMVGDIAHGDAEKLQRELNTRSAARIATKYLLLNSMGGYVEPAYDIARLVHNNGLVTVVDGGAYCVSACMMVFAGGIERWWWDGAFLGVHNASEGENDSAAWTVELAKVYGKMGVPPSIIVKMVSTPSSEIAWLTNDDVAGWANEALPQEAANPQVSMAAELQPQPRMTEIAAASAKRAERRFCKMHGEAYPERCAEFR